MNIEWTNGMLMFVGGIAGCVISLLSMLIATKVFNGKRKRLMKQMESEE